MRHPLNALPPRAAAPPIMTLAPSAPADAADGSSLASMVFTLAERSCTKDAPCDFDFGAGLELFGLAAFTAFLVVVAASAGSATYTEAEAQQEEAETAAEDGFLVEQAARSRQRKDDRLRDLAARLQPLVETTGLPLVDGDGMPTSDAYVFVVVVVAAQFLLALKLAGLV